MAKPKNEVAAEWIRVADLQPWDKNPRLNDESPPDIARSIVRWGFGAPVVARTADGFVIAGHTRLKAVALLPGWWLNEPEAARAEWSADARRLATEADPRVPVRFLDLSEGEARALSIADNRLAELSAWNTPLLQEDLRSLAEDDVDLSDLGFDESALDGYLRDLPPIPAVSPPIPAVSAAGTPDPTLPSPAPGDPAVAGEGAPPVAPPPLARPTLADRFGVPPFSVMNAAAGYWQERKRAWVAVGIASELGRGSNTLGHSDQSANVDFYAQKRKLEAELGTLLSTDDARTELLRLGRISRVEDCPSDRASEVDGRKNGLTWGQSLHPYDGGDEKRKIFAAREEGAASLARDAYASTNLTGAPDLPEWANNGTAQMAPGTSIFDPVLCELAYRWFCPSGGLIFDPFTGGSVRGVVASICGRRYIGLDIRPEQLEANEAQATKLKLSPRPRWVLADATKAAHVANEELVDLVFSCPPYGDLERYSDDPSDLSTMGHTEFIAGYRQAIADAVARLKPNRFAVFVVGDFRDNKGFYRNFVADTIRAFEDSGARLYNEAILVTAVGSLPIRAGRQFASGRKLGKTHQNILVFFRGDPTKIKEIYGEVDFPEELYLPDPSAPAPAPPEAPPAPVGSASPPPAAPVRLEPRVAPPAPRRAEGLPVPDWTPPRATGPVPDWAQGFSVEALKSIVALFESQHRPYVLARFTRLDERAVADAAGGGRLYTRHVEGALVAAVVVRTARAASVISDFADHEIGRIQPGDLRVDRFVAAPGHEEALVALLAEIIADRPAWVETWQEHAVDRDVAGALCLQWAGTRISAASELRGVYASGPATARAADASTYSVAERSHLSPLSLPPIDVGPLLAAVDRLGPTWADHYSTYNLRHSWQAVALRGFGGDPAFIAKPVEMSKAWKEEHPEALGWEVLDTPLRAALPEVEAILALIPGQKERVRLMRLRGGGGELARHSDITDPDAGVDEGHLLRIHVPLRTSPIVEFDGWLLDGSQRRVHMPAGSVYYLDTRKPHRAINPGEVERVHLVMDVWSNPELLRLLSL